LFSHCKHWLMLQLFLSKRSTISTKPSRQAQWSACENSLLKIVMHFIMPVERVNLMLLTFY
jgi:hypothetical protein